MSLPYLNHNLRLILAQKAHLDYCKRFPIIIKDLSIFGLHSGERTFINLIQSVIYYRDKTLLPRPGFSLRERIKLLRDRKFYKTRHLMHMYNVCLGINTHPDYALLKGPTIMSPKKSKMKFQRLRRNRNIQYNWN